MHPPQRPNTGKVGEQFADAIGPLHKYADTLSVRVATKDMCLPRKITFVFAELQRLTEIWVEQGNNHDDDI